MDRWYYAHGNQRMGPISSAELQQLCSKGQLSRTDMVLKEGSQHWTTVATVPELLPKSAPQEAVLAVVDDAPKERVVSKPKGKRTFWRWFNGGIGTTVLASVFAYLLRYRINEFFKQQQAKDARQAHTNRTEPQRNT